MNRKHTSSAGQSGASSSVSLNIGSILSNALLQPLTQQKMKSNLIFNQNYSEQPVVNSASRDAREQYYYEEEYDDEVIDLESRQRADPPIRKIRAVQSADGTERMVADDGYSRGGWALSSVRESEAGESGARKGPSRQVSAGMAFVNSGSAAEKTPERREEEYGEELVYEGDSPEMTKEQFSEAILLEWRERTDEIKKQNDELEDKDEHSRFEHPSIVNFAKAAAAERSLTSTERSFAVESATQSSSLHAIRKRFTADDSLDLESNFHSSPKASKQLLEQLKPYKAKYRHLFLPQQQLSGVSKVEIEYILRKQLQGERTEEEQAPESPENSPFSAMRGGVAPLRRDSLGIASDSGAGHDGDQHTPLLLDKLTSRLSHYYQLNQLLAKTLKHRCHEQSHKFDAGMNRITNVLAGVREVKEATGRQRERLSQFKEETAGQILRVSILRLKQQRLREIQQVMQNVIGKYSTQVLQQVYEMINSGELIEALALIRKAQTEIYDDFHQAMPSLDKGQIHDVKILGMIITRLAQAEECIWKILGHSLQNFCLGHPFSSEQYGQVFHCYSKYSQLCLNARQPGQPAKKGTMEDAGLKLYCDMILQKFEEGLDRAVQVLANSIILGGQPLNPYREQQHQAAMQSGSEQKKQSAEDLIYSVRDCYIALCRVLYNHHMIVRWHHNADMDRQQKQWLTNQLLHVQRPALVAQIDNLATVSIISPLRSKICSRDSGGGKDGLMALPKLTQFLTLTGLLANILGETSHQKKALKIIESTNNQILRVYVERMEKDMIEDFREVLECVEAFERMPVQDGFDIWGKDREDPTAGNSRLDLLDVFRGQPGSEQGKVDQSSYLAQFVHRNPFIEVLPNPKIQGQAQSHKQQARACLSKLQQLMKPQTTLESIHDEYPFLKLGIAQLNSQNLMKLDQLQNHNANFYNIDEDEFDDSDGGSNDSDCLDSSDSGEDQGIQMLQHSASSRPSAPYQTLSRVFGAGKKNTTDSKDWNSDDLIMSISGLSLIRTVLFKHLSMMRALRSHTFEAFVSFTQCVRFYGHVLCSVFIHKDTYHQIFNDVIIYGAAYSQQAKSTGFFTITDRERSRVCRLVHFQARYEQVKKLIVDGQTWVEGRNQNERRSHRVQGYREEMNVQNLQEALGANAETCTLASIQQQSNSLFSRVGEQSSEVNKIQLFLKQVVALHQLQLIQKVLHSPMPSPGSTSQSQVFESSVADSTGGTNRTIKETIKSLLAPNVQQISYMLNFFETQAQLNDSLKELLVRQGLKMLLSPPSSKETRPDADSQQRQRKSMDSDKVLEAQFAQIGQNIVLILSNVPHSHKWSGVERRSEPSGYVNKLLEQIKEFEYKLQRLCSTHHLPQIQIMTEQLWWLWDMIACDLIEQYSLVSEVDATGRQNMISDVEYLVKLCHNIFRSCQFGEASKPAEKTKKKQESLNVPPTMLALREYLQAYFYDLGKLLHFSKKYIQTTITYEQLKRLYRVHPSLQPDSKPQPQAKQSFFKKLTSKQSNDVQPKDVQDFFANVDIFNEDFFRQGIRQEDMSEHPGAAQASTVIVAGLLC